MINRMEDFQKASRGGRVRPVDGDEASDGACSTVKKIPTALDASGGKPKEILCEISARAGKETPHGEVDASGDKEEETFSEIKALADRLDDLDAMIENLLCIASLENGMFPSDDLRDIHVNLAEELCKVPNKLNELNKRLSALEMNILADPTAASNFRSRLRKQLVNIAKLKMTIAADYKYHIKMCYAAKEGSTPDDTIVDHIYDSGQTVEEYLDVSAGGSHAVVTSEVQGRKLVTEEITDLMKTNQLICQLYDQFKVMVNVQGERMNVAEANVTCKAITDIRIGTDELAMAAQKRCSCSRDIFPYVVIVLLIIVIPISLGIANRRL